MALFVSLALALSAAGCASLYLSSRHQLLLKRPLAARPSRGVGALLVAAALPLLCEALRPVVAVFVWGAWVTLLLTLLPYAALLAAGALRGRRKEAHGS